MRDERPVAAVPRWIPLTVAVALCLQIAYPRLSEEAHGARREPSPSAPVPVALLRTAALGEDAAFARIAMLWLQSEDGDGARGVSYRNLDYRRLRAWLGAFLELDPAGLYPLFAAARVYAENPDPEKMRAMLDFVATAFAADPDRRWPAMAHATLLAKHRLKDLPLARRYASELQRRTASTEVPLWARQMEIFILEDMDELQAAKVILGGMLASGRLQEAGERRFLESRLRDLEERIKNKGLAPKVWENR